MHAFVASAAPRRVPAWLNKDSKHQRPRLHQLGAKQFSADRLLVLPLRGAPRWIPGPAWIEQQAVTPYCRKRPSPSENTLPFLLSSTSGAFPEGCQQRPPLVDGAC